MFNTEVPPVTAAVAVPRIDPHVKKVPALRNALNFFLFILYITMLVCEKQYWVDLLKSVK
ncbi:hypothetical protein D0N73_27560 [Pseudomonas fluorescens]|nr:hypothetical protein B0A76_20365 [Pseudomonas fluorescens]RFP93192.1 hypothetical protein D0N73_27560 [Pseudomonas fluorescens]